MSSAIALAAWIAFLVLAFPYVIRMRHPASRPLVAYLVFVMEFSLVAGVVFFILLRLFALIGGEGLLERPEGVAVFLVLVTVPAFALSHWHLRRPPSTRQQRTPE